MLKQLSSEVGVHKDTHYRHSNLGMGRRQTKLRKTRRKPRKDHIERRKSVHLRAPPQAEKSNPIWCVAWSYHYFVLFQLFPTNTKIRNNTLSKR